MLPSSSPSSCSLVIFLLPRPNSRPLRDPDYSINMSAFSFQVITAVSWIFTALAILLTLVRFWIRCKIIKRVSWDDAAHLLGLLLLIAQVSMITGAASMMYRNLDLAAGSPGHYEAGHTLFVRLNIAGIFVTWCCLYAIKLSFLLLYHHIFKISQTFIRAWWIVLGIVLVTFCVLIAGSLTGCGSPSALEHVGKCEL